MMRISFILLIVVVSLQSSNILAEPPPKDRISFETARATALKRFPGKIMSSGLEQHSGTWIYSFEIISPKKSKREITIDAMTGKEVDSSSISTK